MARVKQIRKFLVSNKPDIKYPTYEPTTETVKETEVKEKKNNSKKEKNDMVSKEDIEKAEVAAMGLDPKAVKIVKKDKGLIERTESSKIVLTEDNRQVLND